MGRFKELTQQHFLDSQLAPTWRCIRHLLSKLSTSFPLLPREELGDGIIFQFCLISLCWDAQEGLSITMQGYSHRNANHLKPMRSQAWWYLMGRFSLIACSVSLYIWCYKFLNDLWHKQVSLLCQRWFCCTHLTVSFNPMGFLEKPHWFSKLGDLGPHPSGMRQPDLLESWITGLYSLEKTASWRLIPTCMLLCWHGICDKYFLKV